MTELELDPEARALVDGAVVELRLERGDRVGHAWSGPDGALLAYPLPDGTLRTLPVAPQLLVDALVRLNDVGPRPGPERSQRIVLSAGALAQALATRDAADTGLEEILDGLREHWRVAARWEPAEGALGGRTIEVLDTEAGYWLVVPDGPRVELWPVSPTTVFRGLCGVFPHTAELREPHAA